MRDCCCCCWVISRLFFFFFFLLRLGSEWVVWLLMMRLRWDRFLISLMMARLVILPSIFPSPAYVHTIRLGGGCCPPLGQTGGCGPWDEKITVESRSVLGSLSVGWDGWFPPPAARNNRETEAQNPFSVGSSWCANIFPFPFIPSFSFLSGFPVGHIRI